MLALISLDEIMFVRCLYCIITPFCLFFSSPWKTVIMYSSHLGVGEVLLPSLRVDYLYELFGILLHGRFVSFSPFTDFCNHLFKSITTHRYLFYIWVIINYYCIYCIAQIVPPLAIGSIFSGLPCPFNIAPTLWIFSVFPYCRAI